MYNRDFAVCNKILVFVFLLTSGTVFLSGCNQDNAYSSSIKDFHDPSKLISYVLDAAARTTNRDTLLYEKIAIGTFEINAPYDTNDFNYHKQFITSYNKFHEDIVHPNDSTAIINIKINQYKLPYQILLESHINKTNNVFPIVYETKDSNYFLDRYGKFSSMEGGFIYVTEASCYIYRLKDSLIIEYKEIQCVNSCVLEGITKGLPTL